MQNSPLAFSFSRPSQLSAALAPSYYTKQRATHFGHCCYVPRARSWHVVRGRYYEEGGRADSQRYADCRSTSPPYSTTHHAPHAIIAYTAPPLDSLSITTSQRRAAQQPCGQPMVLLLIAVRCIARKKAATAAAVSWPVVLVRGCLLSYWY